MALRRPVAASPAACAGQLVSTSMAKQTHMLPIESLDRRVMSFAPIVSCPVVCRSDTSYRME
jgi:hypothetical protein